MTTPTSSSSRDNYERDHEIALGEFKHLRRKFTLTNFDNQPFVLVDALAKILYEKSKTLPEDRYQHDLHRLVATSHFRRHTGPPFGLNMLSKYCRILFILLEIGHPHLIEVFHRRNLCDTDLPLDRSRLENELGPLLQDFGHPTQHFYERFHQEQFAWCPMVIEQGMNDVCRNQVVPFLARTEIRPAGIGTRVTQNKARLFTVDVPEELIGSELTKKLDPNLFWEKEVSQDDKSLKRSIRYYKFALKQFPKEHLENAFVKENKAFIDFGVQEGMIQYVGCCEDTNSTCSIILELGDCDLYTAIRNELPPVSPTEISAFWYAMLGLAKALAKIHKTTKDGLEYNVWHADIKPENILRVGDRFKLADPGEALFVIAQGESEPAGAFITGGTRTYAAPEKAPYLEHDAAAPGSVTQNSDVWSLGCVFSVAATYVVLGTQGVLQFDEIRQQSATSYVSSQKTNQRNWPDAFYDGEDVREVVTDWHAYLRSAIRGTDGYTAAVLKMIDDHVLVPARKRWDAVQFSQRLEKLIEGTPSSEAKLFPTYIEEMLREIDPKAMLERERSADGRSRVESDRSKKLLYSHRPSGNGSEALHLTNVGRLLGESIKPTAQRSPIRAVGDKNPQGEIRRSLEQFRSKTISSTNISHADKLSMVLDTNVNSLGGREPSGTGHESIHRPPTMTMWQLERLLQKEGMQRKNLRDIRKLKDVRKKVPASVRGQLGEEDHLEKYYKNRDIVYLVDNGSSMLPHWGEACFLLRVLVWRSLGYDDDGMELYFTNPDTKECVRQSRDQQLSDFEKAMDDAEPLSEGCKTNLCHKLTDIINPYVAQSQSAKKPKAKTIIVLTDGIWQGDRSEDAIRDIIELNMRTLAGISRAEVQSTTTQLHRLTTLSRTRPFTIQFISFGHDKQGLEHMASLDDNMKEYPDVVDVEPSNGDVFKMYAGSLDDIWDNKENNVNRPPITPARSTHNESESALSRRVTPNRDSFARYTGTPAASPLSQD